MTSNQKKSLVAFYLSKYNNKAVATLGYSKMTEALEDLSFKLKGSSDDVNSYIRRRRDEFDVFFDNGRKGYHNRELHKIVKEMFNNWNPVNFEDFTDIVKKIISDEFETKDNILTLTSETENISETDIENYLNFKDENASLSKKVKTVLERNYAHKKIKMLKNIYAYRCQICGENFGENYGTDIAEAHHIRPFSKSVDNSSDNILILCPNHHRLIHKLNPNFNYEKLQYEYSDNKIDKLILNFHLKQGKEDI